MIPPLPNGFQQSLSIDCQKHLVRPCNLDEPCRGVGLGILRLFVEPVGMVLRSQTPVRGDDRLTRRLAFHAEDSQKFCWIGLIPNVERCATTGAIRISRSSVARMIDELEPVPIAQLRKGIGLKPERKAEIEQGRVLMERHRPPGARNDANRRFQQPLPIGRRSDPRKLLPPARHIDRRRNRSRESCASPHRSQRLVRTRATEKSKLKQKRRRDPIPIISRHASRRLRRFSSGDRYRDQNECRDRPPSQDHKDDGNQLHMVNLTCRAFSSADLITPISESSGVRSQRSCSAAHR